MMVSGRISPHTRVTAAAMHSDMYMGMPMMNITTMTIRAISSGLIRYAPRT